MMPYGDIDLVNIALLINIHVKCDMVFIEPMHS